MKEGMKIERHSIVSRGWSVNTIDNAKSTFRRLMGDFLRIREEIHKWYVKDKKEASGRAGCDTTIKFNA